MTSLFCALWQLDEWVLCKVYTPKHAKHSKNGQKSDHPTKKRNKQNHDQPNGNKDNAPTTAGKNQGQKKAIIVDDGYLQELQSTPNHELNMSQQVDVVDNYQLPQSSQISALGGLETDQPTCNVLSHRNHMHPNVMAHRPSGMRINMHLQVHSVVTQPANLEPPTWQPTGNYPPESRPSRSSCLPAHSARQNPRQVVVYSFNDLISTNPYYSLPHNRWLVCKRALMAYIDSSYHLQLGLEVLLGLGSLIHSREIDTSLLLYRFCRLYPKHACRVSENKKQRSVKLWYSRENLCIEDSFMTMLGTNFWMQPPGQMEEQMFYMLQLKKMNTKRKLSLGFCGVLLAKLLLFFAN